jgi:hypothetical protein
MGQSAAAAGTEKYRLSFRSSLEAKQDRAPSVNKTPTGQGDIINPAPNPSGREGRCVEWRVVRREGSASPCRGSKSRPPFPFPPDQMGRPRRVVAGAGAASHGGAQARYRR